MREFWFSFSSHTFALHVIFPRDVFACDGESLMKASILSMLGRRNRGTCDVNNRDLTRWSSSGLVAISEDKFVGLDELLCQRERVMILEDVCGDIRWSSTCRSESPWEGSLLALVIGREKT